MDHHCKLSRMYAEPADSIRESSHTDIHNQTMQNREEFMYRWKGGR